jgi:hypothetical protein
LILPGFTARRIMRHSFAIAAYAGLAAAHGQIKQFIVDGNTYPAFDPSLDYDAKWNSKRIEWGFAKAKGGVGPVENVASPDITCRFNPLNDPGIEAPVRAGSTVSFQWLDWFQSHKGPVLTVSTPKDVHLRIVLTALVHGITPRIWQAIGCRVLQD